MIRTEIRLIPPEHPGSDDDPGVMGINYRCEPMRERLKIKNDPSHIFSSFVYGDPDTPIRYNEYPSVPLDLKHEPSYRVSLSPQFLKYDPIVSSGINVGYNAVEQTAGPGECIKYLWHADREYGTVMLNSFGDLRNHRHHGLFGAIIIEPAGAKYYNSILPVNENYNEQAVITAPGVKSFREFVLFAHNGIRLLDKDGELIKTTE